MSLVVTPIHYGRVLVTLGLRHKRHFCPAFGGGCDLKVVGGYVTLHCGSYESGPSCQLIELAQNGLFSSGFPSESVTCVSTPAPATIELVNQFSTDVNNAINTKKESLVQAELNIPQLEESFDDGFSLISTFASNGSKDITMLNVNGTIMTKKEPHSEPLMIQFLPSSLMTPNGQNEWTPGDVSTWMKNTTGVPDHVADYFKESEMTDCKLLALGVGVMK
ncbi:hypothetical protein ACHAWF_002830 [Thalassiosira exigua]